MLTSLRFGFTESPLICLKDRVYSTKPRQSISIVGLLMIESAVMQLDQGLVLRSITSFN